MSQPIFDPARLHMAEYDLNNPLHAAKFQCTVEDFIGLVRDNTFRYPSHKKLLDDFCDFVDQEEVWCLAQTMIPEFRLARVDQPRYHVDVTEESKGLSYILGKLTLLPAPRCDKNILTTEQDLLRQRHNTWVDFLVTGGKGRTKATASDLVESDARAQRVQHRLGARDPQADQSTVGGEDTGSGSYGKDNVEPSDAEGGHHKVGRKRKFDGDGPFGREGEEDGSDDEPLITK